MFVECPTRRGLVLAVVVGFAGCGSHHEGGATSVEDARRADVSIAAETAPEDKSRSRGNAPASNTGAEQLALSADGRFVATCYSSRAGHAISVWDVASGDRIAEMEQPDWFSAAFRHGVALSPDGSLVASARHAGQDRRLKVWETKTGTLRNQFQIAGAGHVAFSQDGKRIYWHQMNRHVVVIDLETGDQEQVGLADHQPSTVAFSPTAPIAAIERGVLRPASGMGETTLCLFDLTEHKVVNSKTWEWGQPNDIDAVLIHAMEFSGDGRKIADAGIHRIRIRDAQSLEVEASVSGGGNSPEAMAVSANGRFVVVVDDGTVGIWDTSGASALRETMESLDCEDLQFLPNGVLVLAFKGGPLRFVDPVQAREVPFSAISGMRIAAALD